MKRRQEKTQKSNKEQGRNKKDGSIRSKGARERGSERTGAVNVDLLFSIQSQKRRDQSVEQ